MLKRARPRPRLLAPERKLVSELEADGNAHEHAEPRLLGHQCANRGGTLLLVVLTRNAAYLRFVGIPEPAAFGERFGKYALKRGSGMDHDILGMCEPPGLDERCQCRVHLRCGVGPIGQSRLIIGAAQSDLARLRPRPSVKPSSPPVTPAIQLTSGRAYGIASNTAAIAAVPSRSPS